MALTPKQKKLPKGLQEAILKSQKKVKRKRRGKNNALSLWEQNDFKTYEEKEKEKK